jgi:hypothetical protein
MSPLFNAAEPRKWIESNGLKSSAEDRFKGTAGAIAGFIEEALGG